LHKRPFAFLVISIAILLLRFSPDHLGDFLWAVFVVILIEFANRYSRVYGALRWFQKIKGIIFEWNLKRKIKKSIKNKQEETYLKVLIENALENAKSTDVIERKLRNCWRFLNVEWINSMKSRLLTRFIKFQKCEENEC